MSTAQRDSRRGPRLRRRSRDSCSPATGWMPACPPPSKAPCRAVTRRRMPFCGTSSLVNCHVRCGAGAGGADRNSSFTSVMCAPSAAREVPGAVSENGSNVSYSRDLVSVSGTAAVSDGAERAVCFHLPPAGSHRR
jgi:hypothetical protein